MLATFTRAAPLRDRSCGLQARLDTFQTADRLERNGGIYWLCHADLGGVGREDSIFLLLLLLSVLLPFLYHLNLSPFFFRQTQKVVQIPVFPNHEKKKKVIVILLAAPFVGVSYAPSLLGMSPCAPVSFLRNA